MIAVESSPSALALEGEKLWTATLPSLGSHRGGVLRVESFPLGCDCVDPAFIEDYPEGQFVLPLVHDGLVAYRRVNGIGGGTLVANLAERLPTPTDQGRTYTFQLRPGVRFSDGAPVRPSDFRYSLERLLTIDPGQASTYGIVGAAGCAAAGSEVCDLSQGIEVDDATGTITIRLNEADPDFLHKLAFPSAFVVPAGTPPRKVTDGSIPTTGPYRIASLDPKRELRLFAIRTFACGLPTPVRTATRTRSASISSRNPTRSSQPWRAEEEPTGCSTHRSGSCKVS